MNSKWLQFALKILAVVPATVQAVEVLAAGAPGSTKKALAMNSLGLGSAVASAVAPEHQAEISAATSLVSSAIDNVVAVTNFVNSLKSGTPVTPPVSAPAVTSVSAPASEESSTSQMREGTGGR